MNIKTAKAKLNNAFAHSFNGIYIDLPKCVTEIFSVDASLFKRLVLDMTDPEKLDFWLALKIANEDAFKLAQKRFGDKPNVSIAINLADRVNCPVSFLYIAHQHKYVFKHILKLYYLTLAVEMVREIVSPLLSND